MKKKHTRHYIAAVFISCILLFAGSGVCKGLSFSIDELNLTPREQHWLHSNASITIGGPKAFPPFHYFDEQENLKGISSDYIFAIMELLGLDLKIERNLPWPEVLEKAKNGEIDMIPCTAKTKEREDFLNFSIPYLSFPLVILSRKDAPFIGGIEDLHGKKLAVIKKNVISAWLEKDGIHFEPYQVDSPIKGLEAVSLGQVDAGIENLAAVSYIIQHHGLTNIKIAAPTPYGNYNLYMAVRKGLPELSSIIDKVLGKITPEQHIQFKSKWLTVRYEHGLNKTDIVKWVLITILFSAVVLTIILIWNRKLKKEVAQRVKLIEQLESAVSEIKTLEGIVPICSQCKKIRDDKGYWNLLESYIEKHSEASFSHGMCPECQDKFYGSEQWYIQHKKKQVRD